MQKYAEILKRLYSVNLFKAKKEDLHIIERAAELIGNPHKDLRFIHVAGTNGKGSVTTKCAKILELSGYKTGLFISPHISSFRERIQINGQLVEREFVVDILEDLFKLSEKHQLDLTFFDYVTLLGFQYFKEKKAELVCLEVGLGGRLDATNIVDPLVSVITSIGLDHVETLGPTINHIAQEKAGIIKPKRPVVLGPCLPEEIFIQKANQTESPVFSLKPDEFTVKDFNNENVRIARETIKVLCETYPDIKVTNEAISEGSKAFQPCRLEAVDTSVLGKPELKDTKVFLDVGHNLPAIEKCMITLTLQHPGHNIRVIYGSSEHKDIYSCLEALKDYAYKVHLVQAKHGRAKSLAKLQESVEQVKSELVEESASALFEKVVNEGDIESTIDYALKQASKAEKPEVVVVIGSFYIMAEARKYFKYNDEFDPVY